MFSVVEFVPKLCESIMMTDFMEKKIKEIGGTKPLLISTKRLSERHMKFGEEWVIPLPEFVGSQNVNDLFGFDGTETIDSVVIGPNSVQWATLSRYTYEDYIISADWASVLMKEDKFKIGAGVHTWVFLSSSGMIYFALDFADMEDLRWMNLVIREIDPEAESDEEEVDSDSESEYV